MINRKYLIIPHESYHMKEIFSPIHTLGIIQVNFLDNRVTKKMLLIKMLIMLYRMSAQMSIELKTRHVNADRQKII